MDVCVSVCVADFVVVNLGKPVVSGNGTGVRKDKTADRIGNCGVLFYAPVIDFNIVI